MEIINIDKVTFNYPESESSALKDISLSIKEGELVLIVGPSGCGKSTLVRLLNRIIPDYYGGTLKGEVYIKGKNIENIDKYNMVKSVGMVYQHPEKQIILQDVEREIAFGLENLNTDVEIMKRNVAEVISLLGLNDIKDRQTTEISGGQKQRVAIASVVSMDPDIILFDEPISQLDPIAGEEVLNSIKKLNRDMGKTVILVEQRLDKCFHMADRIIFMEEGRIIGEGTPHDIPENIHRKYHLPNIAYIFKKAGINTIPVSVKEGREVLEEMNFKEIKVEEENKNYSQCIMEVNKLNFEYEKGSKTLNNINLKLHKGEIMSVMGENGAGKSTLFKIICGLIDSYTGKILIENENLKKINMDKRIKKIGYLSQNPNDYFGRKTVFQEVGYTLENIDEYDEKRVSDVLKLLDLTHLKDRNPRDLSGGEKQRTAIACTLVADPDILILDEPTRGMDSTAKEKLGGIIKELSSRGKSIVLITHDADFAGDYVDSVVLMFNGEIVAKGAANAILYNSIYYSPQIAKVFKKKCRVIKSEDAIEILKVI
ncbi:energy-coupling factor transport system ATP-binding protein [Clostridium tetanomorphum]|uniref:ABC transporter ATP-binding protein n=1 Tax=Clostridium tetanomorphum TaxID=1553 RepID=UPI00044717C1|nr:energy-coupling factor transporter ATPase [Clostridium tetanomorphum]KAJ50360.1 cobalt transport ATP-binding protein [Clostridium tetanomorphum DSM 665]MBP1866026.1 energy-coupling factor transport system ATP-binding protein [Clostridium tetanomorphum]NRS83294.1 energy-coupling factor transport system ATP-binding protein [Clostridium tetanomorphum]NRZ96498.1 energy-coupling factor transport system ATP-binding protein [Clostridium tetanomorphum]